MAIAGLTIFFLIGLTLLLAGVVSAVKQVLFLRRAKEVQGRAISEWRFRSTGNTMRYYRVEFVLSTGQRVQMRSGGATARMRPRVGQSVAVFVREVAGQGPKAQIGTWQELWFVPVCLLFMGAIWLAVTVVVFTTSGVAP